MNINIKESRINLETTSDFENAMENILYAFKINQGMSDLENGDIYSEESVYSELETTNEILTKHR